MFALIIQNKMKAAEYSNMSVEDLKGQITEKRAELAKMKFNHTIAGTENPMVLRNIRREIARMLTVLNQKENNG